MFHFWIRRQVRRIMQPIPVEKAQFYANFFTYSYVLVAWTIFGSLTYLIMNQKRKDPAMARQLNEHPINSGFYYGRIFKADNMKIYSVDGLSLKKDGEYQFDNDVKLQKEMEELAKDFYGEEPANELKQ